MILLVMFVAIFVIKITGRIPVPSFAIFGEGFVGSILGLIALIRKDRSIALLISSAVIGLFIVLFVGAELLFPH